MKVGLGDRVVDEINNRFKGFIGEIRNRHKDDKPLRGKAPTDEEMYYDYVQNFEVAPDKFQRMQGLIQEKSMEFGSTEKGMDWVNDYLYKMNKLKRRFTNG